MVNYLPNIPQANDDLSDSQPQILNNFTKADSSFGIDHYAFSDATANNGFHKQITNPVSALEPTTTTDPILYSLQQTVPIGVIQYSKGPSNVIATPITSLHSSSVVFSLASSASIDIFDFTGLARAFATFRVYGLVPTLPGGIVCNVMWDGTVVNIQLIQTVIGASCRLSASVAGNKLRLTNTNPSQTYTNIFWTLELQRLA